MKSALIHIAVRAFRTFLQSVIIFTPAVALAAGGAAGEEFAKVMPKEFAMQFWLAVQLSLAPVVGSILHNALEKVMKYEGTLKG